MKNYLSTQNSTILFVIFLAHFSPILFVIFFLDHSVFCTRGWLIRLIILTRKNAIKKVPANETNMERPSEPAHAILHDNAPTNKKRKQAISIDKIINNGLSDFEEFCCA